ncbi:MAG TPA: DNA repair protein RecO [Clostridiales bacterium]|nr:DNA repair protein RecO [Clostridiales bacterium]
MEQIKFTGIVLKSVDYKEKDKLITIFSLELGLITATLKSVRQEKAKLKFASMPFCFGEFVATKKNDYLLITECYQIESFYNIISNYQKSVIGFLMLELTSIIMRKEPDDQWFLTLINYLKILEYSDINPNIIAIKFMLNTLNKIGYGLSFDCCSECGLKFNGDVYINLEMGELECSSCKSVNSVKLSRQQFGILKNIDAVSLNNVNTIKQKDDVLVAIRNVLKHNLSLRTGCNIKSI